MHRIWVWVVHWDILSKHLIFLCRYSNAYGVYQGKLLETMHCWSLSKPAVIKTFMFASSWLRQHLPKSGRFLHLFSYFIGSCWVPLKLDWEYTILPHVNYGNFYGTTFWQRILVSSFEYVLITLVDAIFLRSYHLIITGSILLISCLFLLSLAQPEKYYQVRFKKQCSYKV